MSFSLPPNPFWGSVQIHQQFWGKKHHNASRALDLGQIKTFSYLKNKGQHMERSKSGLMEDSALKTLQGQESPAGKGSKEWILCHCHPKIR